MIIGCVLIVLHIIIPTSQAKGESQSDKFINKLDKSCESTVCAHLPNGFNDNCVNYCISSICFTSVYKHYLEEGEVDYKRTQLFKNCVKAILKECQGVKKSKQLDECSTQLHIQS